MAVAVTFCHFRVSVAGAPPQTVVFHLDTDKCPQTCANFIALCQSPATARRPTSSSSSTTPPPPPTYRGTEFHRILPNFMIQGGDFTRFDGSGGHAASATNKGLPTFRDENFTASHDREGVLSMANRGPHTNGSQFFVTLGPSPHLDGKHVAFGRVVEGMATIRDVARVETVGDGRPAPLQRVVVVDCGLGAGDDDDDDGSGSSSSSSSARSYSSDDDRRRRRSGAKKRIRRSREEEEEAHHHHGKRSRDESRRSKKRRKQRDREDDRRDRKRRKERNGKESRRRRSKRDGSPSEEQDGHARDRHARSPKKRRNSDRRRSDDRHPHAEKSDKK